ncbi:MAG: NUDIX hydrolase [Sphaerochaetaceae bacterium]
MQKLTEAHFSKYDPQRDDSHLAWSDCQVPKPVFSCPIFNVQIMHRASTDGREGDFARLEAPDWVTMIPIFTGEDGVRRFVMERQFRHGSSTVTIEFPAGLVEKGESPKDAALRELAEETGLTCGKCTAIGCVNPNSAFMDNHSTFFLMEELSIASCNQILDANEQIDVLTISEDELIQIMGSGKFNNGMMMVALGFYLREKMIGRS